MVLSSACAGLDPAGTGDWSTTESFTASALPNLRALLYLPPEGESICANAHRSDSAC